MTRQRFYYLDYARGFIIALVVLQHAIQGYAQFWGGRFWFLALEERGFFFDALFFWTDNFIMAALFFIAGLFVFPSLERRGLVSFLQEKTLRLFIPAVIGKALIVPLLTYPRLAQHYSVSFGDHLWQGISGTAPSQWGGFWFLVMLFAFCVCSAILVRLPLGFKALISGLGNFCIRFPKSCLTLTAVLSIAITTYTDILYGAQWWVSLKISDFNIVTSWHFFDALLVARGNQFSLYIIYFFTGLAIGSRGLGSFALLLDKARPYRYLIFTTMALASIAYVTYCLTYMYDGAFSTELREYYYHKGSFTGASTLLWEDGLFIIIRTTLMALLCLLQTLAVVLWFYCYRNMPDPMWISLASCSYGIFFLHEPMVLGFHYLQQQTGLAPIMQASIAFFIPLAGSWAMTQYGLKQVPGLRHIFK